MSYRNERKLVALLDRCRDLRQNSTSAELLLWGLLRNRQVNGAKFRRQHEFVPFILDFYCPEQGLCIELDGGQHYEEVIAARDADRTRFLNQHGIKVLRFSDREVFLETAAVLTAIWSEVTPSP